MNDTTLSQWVMTHADLAQYVIYFSLVASFGAWEALRPGHPAVTARLRRWPTNFAMTLLNVVIPPLVPLSGIAAARWAQANHVGLLNVVPLGVASGIVITLVLRSLASYINHVLMHKVPVLWRLHRVHHSDTMLDVSTTVRFHPLEFAPGLAVQLPIIVAGGLSPWVLMAYELLDIGVNVVTHANVRWTRSAETAVELLFATPAVHRIHHSALQPETDSNYGAVFTFWDRLFGTFKRPAGSDLDGMRIGLNEIRGPRVSALGYQLASPWFDRYEDKPPEEAGRTARRGPCP